MRNLKQHLTSYAAYHRDPRNIATHYVGIPMIMLGISGLLGKTLFVAGGLPVSAVALVSLALAAFYFSLDLRFGAVMAAVLGLSSWAGHSLASQSSSVWLGASIGGFVIGWAIQFIGHVFEGRKPAFVDDIIGLFQGPLFLVAELGFALGMRPELHESIVAEVGPVRVRKPSSAASA